MWNLWLNCQQVAFFSECSFRLRSDYVTNEDSPIRIVHAPNTHCALHVQCTKLGQTVKANNASCTVGTCCLWSSKHRESSSTAKIEGNEWKRYWTACAGWKINVFHFQFCSCRINNAHSRFNINLFRRQWIDLWHIFISFCAPITDTTTSSSLWFYLSTCATHSVCIFFLLNSKSKIRCRTSYAVRKRAFGACETPAKLVFIGDLFLLRLLCATPIELWCRKYSLDHKINNCRMLYRLVAVNENQTERNDHAPCSNVSCGVCAQCARIDRLHLLNDKKIAIKSAI